MTPMRWQAHDPLAGLVLMVNFTADQRAYRFRNDDGSETSATWIAAQNTPIQEPPGENFRLRIEVQETAGGSSNNVDHNLQYRIDGGTWTNITDASAGVRLRPSTFVANETPTTNQLTAGTGAFRPGSVVTTVSQVRTSYQGNDHSEYEWCIEIVENGALVGSTIEFRVTLNGAVANTTTATPTLVIIPPPTRAQVEHGLTIGHSLEGVIPTSATVGHGLTLGHDVEATARMAAEAAHGLIVGHSGETFTPVRVSHVDSGLAPGTGYTYRVRGVSESGNEGVWSDPVQVETGPLLEATVEISHGLILGHKADSSASITSDAAHGLVVGHAIGAAAVIDAEISHGLVVGHAAASGAVSSEADISHGLSLGHSVEATLTTYGDVDPSESLEGAQQVASVKVATVGAAVTTDGAESASYLKLSYAEASHGLALGHEVDAAVRVAAESSHGLVLGHEISTNAKLDAEVSHGLVVGHKAASGQMDLLASISHGVVVGHSVEAHVTQNVEVIAASESSVPGSVVSQKITSVGSATESSIASEALSKRHHEATGAIELSQAREIRAVKYQPPVGVATESSEASNAFSPRIGIVGVAEESSYGRPVTVVFGHYTEHGVDQSSARPVTVAKVWDVGVAESIDEARSVAHQRSQQVDYVVDGNNARPVLHSRIVEVGAASETSEARAIGSSRATDVASAASDEHAQPATWARRYHVGFASGVDDAQSVSNARVTSVAHASEQSDAQSITASKGVYVGRASTTDVGLRAAAGPIYLDEDLSQNTTYSYRVRAVGNSDHEGIWSEPIEVTTLDMPTIVGVAIDHQIATPVARFIRVGTALEESDAGTLSSEKRQSVGVAVSADVATSVFMGGAWATEENIALPVSYFKTVAPAIERSEAVRAVLFISRNIDVEVLSPRVEYEIDVPTITSLELERAYSPLRVEEPVGVLTVREPER